jgi:hypothetical protein
MWKLPLALLVVLSAALPLSAADEETYSLELSGAVTGTMEPGNSYGSVKTVEGTTPPTVTLQFVGQKPLRRTVAMVFNAVTPAPGTYEITGSGAAGTVSALVVDSTEKMRPFAGGSGKVTLEAAGETLSGILEFTVSDETGKVTVKGKFTNIK